MIEKGLKSRICHRIHPYVKGNNKYLQDYEKNKKSLYLSYWYVNNLDG